MKPNYNDLLRLGQQCKRKPLWYDENGAPRFVRFHPKYSTNPYTSLVVLARIRCTECNREFLVEMTSSYLDSRIHFPPISWTYGRPPDHECDYGCLKAAKHIEIVRAYRYSKSGWIRRQDLEGVCIESMNSETLERFRKRVRL